MQSSDQSTTSQQKAQPDKPTLHIPSGISYSCQGCGKCCGQWAIGLTYSDYDKVKDTDWAAVEPRLAGRELFLNNEKQHAEGLSAYPYFTKSASDGYCPFLVDNLCVIHKTLGEENKPTTCRLFPYTFSPTPDGVYVGLAYSSTAAAKNAGRPLTEQEEYLQVLFQAHVAHKDAQAGSHHQAGDSAAVQTKEPASQTTEVAAKEPSGPGTEVEAKEPSTPSAGAVNEPPDQPAAGAFQYQLNLVQGVPISWPEYKLVEARLASEFAGDKPVLEAILNSLIILDTAADAKRDGKDLEFLTQFTPNTNPFSGGTTLVENLLFNMLCFRFFVLPAMRDAQPEKWALLGYNALSDPAVVKTALGTVLGGKMMLEPGKRIDIRQVRRAKMQALPAEFEETLCRFMRLKLFAKNYFGPFFGGFSLSTGFNTLVSVVLATLIQCKAAAASRNETGLSRSDLYQALTAADREQLSFTQLAPEKAAWFDLGLSTPTTLGRLVHELKKSCQP